VIFDGSLLRDLVIQTPVIALLVIFMVLDRRDHAKTVATLREENARLQQALIDHMNRLME
jgi:hypothetical protein